MPNRMIPALLIIASGIAFGISPQEESQMIAALPEKPIVRPQQSRTVLVVNLCGGFSHPSIPYVSRVLELMGQRTGAYEAVITNDLSYFQPGKLDRFDAIVFNNTVRIDFGDPVARKSLMDFIAGGKGVVGIHAATDNFYDFPQAAEMFGGQFAGHPWIGKPGQAVTIKLDDPTHPLNAMFEDKSFSIVDEIYQFGDDFYSRENLHVLASLDMDQTPKGEGMIRADNDYAISWVRSFGKGRLFYCSLGHNPEVTWNPIVLKQYLAGIQFAAGDLPCDTNPSYPRLAKLRDLLKLLAKYEYGGNRQLLDDLFKLMLRIESASSEASQFSSELASFLNSDATEGGQQYACRMLSLIGDSAAVGVLSDMLDRNVEDADRARYALEQIPGDEPLQALRTALSSTKRKQKIGIINSLAVRRDAKAVGLLAGSLTEEISVASAALSAMGKIGGEQAWEILNGAESKLPDVLRSAWTDAVLKCAETLVKAGHPDKAAQAYRNIFTKGESVAGRIAALDGLAGLQDSSALPLVIHALNDPDARLRAKAVRYVALLPGQEATAAFLAQLKKSDTANQEAIVRALGVRGDKSALPEVEKMLRSEDVGVRIAAVETIGRLGDDQAVLLLAHAAAGASDEEQKAARNSLYRLRGKGVDAAILAQIDEADAKPKVELILAIEKRSIDNAVSSLLRRVQDPDKSVRKASYDTLRSVSEPKYLPEMLDILVKIPDESEREMMEHAVIQTGLAIEDKQARADSVLEVYSRVQDTAGKCSLLRVMGGLGNSKSLPVLYQATESQDTEMVLAAIKVLAYWPTSEPMLKLLNTAQNTSDDRRRILALRGVVRMFNLPSDLSADRLGTLAEAVFALARTTDDKKLVVGGMANMKSPGVLKMLAGLMADEVIKAETQISLLKVARNTGGTDPEVTKSVLREMYDRFSDEPSRQQAREIINFIERFDNFITAWQVSGPYLREDSKDNGPLLDMRFGPENPAWVEKPWDIMPAGLNADQPWLIDLLKHFGGEKRVAYLRTHIWSDQFQVVQLELGSDDGIKVWVNGEVVLAKDLPRGHIPGDDKVKVALEHGWNKLVLKISQDGGLWGACARIRRADGTAPTGIKITANLSALMETGVNTETISYFTSPGFVQITGISVTASSDAFGRVPQKAVDGSHMDVDQFRGDDNDCWQSEPILNVKTWPGGPRPQGEWIEFDLGKLYALKAIKVWGYGGGHSAKTADILYSSDGKNWVEFLKGEHFDLPGGRPFGPTDTLFCGGTRMRYVRFKITENYGADSVGFSEVRFFAGE